MRAGKRIAVGLSGGIDSAVAAAILLRGGHDVQAVTMRIWDRRFGIQPERRSACFGPGEAEDIETARAVAEWLGIRHTVIPLAGDYEKHVLSYCRREYLAGRTPNPCVVCNAAIKFGALVSAFGDFGIESDLFAMGHYARIDREAHTNVFRLLRGADSSKDQSYFLHRLNQRQLAGMVLPLGDRRKRDVIALAREWRLPRVAERKESQDFMADGARDVLFEGARVESGPIVDSRGSRVGTHRGLVHYTVGQRSGLGVSLGRPKYVKEIRADSNIIVVGDRDELMAPMALLEDVHWVAGGPPARELTCLVRLRYRHDGVRSTVTVAAAGGRAQVVFDEPQFAVTPGQAAVFYLGDEVLGGGWIAGIRDS